MKYFLLISLPFFSTVSFAMKAKECPQAFYAQLSVINTFEEATIATRSDILTLTSTSDSMCRYEGEHNVLNARIEGSLEKGAKKPAQLVVYFNGNTKIDYVAYVNVLEKDAQGRLNFSGSAEVYKTDEFCAYGECTPEYAVTGSALFGFGYDLSSDYK